MSIPGKVGLGVGGTGVASRVGTDDRVGRVVGIVVSSFWDLPVFEFLDALDFPYLADLPVLADFPVLADLPAFPE